DSGVILDEIKLARGKVGIGARKSENAGDIRIAEVQAQRGAAEGEGICEIDIDAEARVGGDILRSSDGSGKGSRECGDANVTGGAHGVGERRAGPIIEGERSTGKGDGDRGVGASGDFGGGAQEGRIRLQANQVK